MLKQFYSINQVVGLSIKILTDGEVQLNACEVLINGSKLNFVRKLMQLESLNELKQYFDVNTPFSINISGKGVLYKKTGKVELIDHQNFNKVLPNANLDDFYVQNFISADTSFVTIIRKSEVNKWLDSLKSIGFATLMLSLGPFPIHHILQQLNFYDQDIEFDGYAISVDEQHHWISCSESGVAFSSFPLKVESEMIDQKLIVPYAAAFQILLADKLIPIHASVAELTENFEETINSKKFRIYGLTLLMIFLVLLMVNFLIFTSLNSYNNELYEKLSQFTQISQNTQGLVNQIKQKETLVKTLGYDDDINKISFLDQIAAVLPSDVMWQSVSLNPVNFEGSRIQKTLVFFAGRIVVMGTSDQIIPLNEWIARIKTQPWVKNIQLDSYVFNHELNTGEFYITITY